MAMDCFNICRHGHTVGPDGLPAVCEGGAWLSHDRSLSWDGTAWVPTPESSAAGTWPIRIATIVFMVALLDYAI
jgi:hypothetical protein